MLGESIATAEFSVASTKDCAGHALDYVALDYVALDYVGLLHFKEQAGLLGLEATNGRFVGIQ